MIALLRYDEERSSCVLAVSNFTPVLRHDYRVGVPMEGRWVEVLNSDAAEFGGSDHLIGEVWAETAPAIGRGSSINLRLPPLSTVYLKWTRP